jgi:hypothetical protein
MVYPADQRSENRFQPEESFVLSVCGYGRIYKLYAHSNRFNDFPELIVYVYAQRNKSALNKRIEN